MADAPTDRTQVHTLLGLSTVLTAVTVLAIAARCVIRFVLIRDPGMDDYMIILSLIFTIAFVAMMYWAASCGLGDPMTTLSLTEMTNILKSTFVVEIVYYAAIFCVKSSIVFMYTRFAISEGFKKLCLGTNILLALFFVVCIGTTVGQCTPLYKFWDVTKLVSGNCINTTAFFYFTSGFNILTDLWILGLPIPTLRKLQISRHNRYVLYGVFGVGAFASAMSCVRLYSIHTYTQAQDPFKDGVLINIWSIVEMTVAIWCASAPALKPLFTPSRLMEARKQRKGGYSSRGNHSDEPSGFSKMSTHSATPSQSHIVPVQTHSRDGSDRRASPTTDDFEMQEAARSQV
ncbi:hypothetical protein F5Y15DRAFT_129702 [Xylariaceae sp. FL0016]|nr:hypothetical protein F5Y15DRAFT_129702 [Xylariaceae sp. FL0016]